MIRIHALNEDEDCDEDVSSGVMWKRPTREALEQEALDMLNNTFETIARNQVEEAISTLDTILDLPILQEDTKKYSPLQFQIKLGCLKTLGTIYYSMLPQPMEAIRILKLTLAIDPQNVTLWYRLGIMATKCLQLELAYVAFAQGYDTNSGHWGCLENLILLSYVLLDSSTCLNYCALGLLKDPCFFRGLVFRDHIFRLQPSIQKEMIEKYPILKLSDTTYSKDWEIKYLNEIEDLTQQQAKKNRNELLNETLKSSEVYVCEHIFQSFTFLELCSTVIKLYDEVKIQRALLRPLSFINEGTEISEMIPERIARCQNVVELVENVIKTNITSVDKENQAENVEANGDSLQDCMSMDKDHDEEGRERIKSKKTKRDVKWWQLEGKRRSERVRGNLICPNVSSEKKRTDFASTLRRITFSPIVLSEDHCTTGTTNEENLNQQQPLLNVTAEEVEYFGKSIESYEVKEILNRKNKLTVIDLITKLTRFLADRSNFVWPVELGQTYLNLHLLYRNHIPIPDPFTCDEFLKEMLPLECRILITVLEIMFSTTPFIKLKSNEGFNKLLFTVRELVSTINDRILLARFNWLMANYYLSLAPFNTSNFEISLYFLKELKLQLLESENIVIPPIVEGKICLEELQKKRNLIQRLENINRVTQLYESKNFEELVEVLNLCSKDGMDTNNQYILADSYYQLHKYPETVRECLHILKNVSKLPSQMVQKVIILLKRAISISTCQFSASLLRETAQLIVNLIIENPTSGHLPLISPWIILHTILFKAEQNDLENCEQKTTPASILILQLAHEHLGRHGKCSANKGKLLTYILDSLLPLTVDPEYNEFEGFKHALEQAVFCLYGHPTKISKVRYLIDHSTTVTNLDMTRAEQLYRYYRPSHLPEFDTYTSISESDAALFLHILTIIPQQKKPTNTFEQLTRFLNGDAEAVCPEVGEGYESQFIDIFYLLGDHYFKVKDWTKSTEFYTWDLSVCPKRFDSWAGIALAKAERVTTQLNSCDALDIHSVIKSGELTLECFQKALILDPLNSKMKLEFGSFLYSMHSFCSRLLKQNTNQLNLNYSIVERKKEEFLKLSAKCFEPLTTSNHVNDPNGTLSYEVREDIQEELWVNHYMLGKVMEKLVPSDPESFLRQYELAAKLLDERGAAYPMKINFYTPQVLAIEALEMFYRIHASILSYIGRTTVYNKSTEDTLLKYVERISQGPFMRAKLKRPESATEANKRKKGQEKAIAEVKMLMSELIDRVDEIVQELSEESSKPIQSPSTQSSSTSSSDNSTDSSSGDESSSVASIKQQRPLSFGLSVFQAKLREKEKREFELEQAAKFAEKSNLDSVGVPEATGVLEVAGIHGNDDDHFRMVPWGSVIVYCVNAMKECVVRFPAHHKAYFRLSSTYYTFCTEHVQVSRDWLLGSSVPDKKKIVGLFGDRKPTNFFNGIWRSPIDDIDRPGSFPYHMTKTIQNLLDVLNQLDDHEMLIEIGIQLAKTPESDKKYLYNYEREKLSEQALKTGVAAANRCLLKALDLEEAAMGIYSSYLKIQKSALKVNPIGSIILDAYKLDCKITDNSIKEPTVDMALAYYRHLSWTRKLKGKVNTTTLPGRSAVRLSNDVFLRRSVTKKPTIGQVLTKKRNGEALMPQMNVPSSIFNNLLPNAVKTYPEASSNCQPLTSIPAKVSSSNMVPRPNSKQPGREIPNLLTVPPISEDLLQKAKYPITSQSGLIPKINTIRNTGSSDDRTSLPQADYTLSPAWMEAFFKSTAKIKPQSIESHEQNPNYNNLGLSSPWIENMMDSTISKSGIPSTTANSLVTNSTLAPAHSNAHQPPKLPKIPKKFVRKFTILGNQSILPPSSPSIGSELKESLKAKGQLQRSNSEDVKSNLNAKTKGISCTLPATPTHSLVLEGKTLPIVGYQNNPPITANVMNGQSRNTSNTHLITKQQQLPSSKLPDRKNSTGVGQLRKPNGSIPKCNPIKNESVEDVMPRRNTIQSIPRDSSPSLLRTPPPPCSMPPRSTASTWNTSPFKAQSRVISSPDQFILGLPYNSRRSASPPAAHSASKTPPLALTGSSITSDLTDGLEIIDLTTKMAGTSKGTKRAMPQMFEISKEIPSDSHRRYSLPPKKKLLLRKSDGNCVNRPLSGHSTRIEPEVITID